MPGTRGLPGSGFSLARPNSVRAATSAALILGEGKMTAGSSREAQKTPKAVFSEGVRARGEQSRTAGRKHDVIMLGIGVGAVARILRSRRFHVGVISGAIALAALRGMARENRTRAFARLTAWDKRQNLRRHDRTARSST
jgi:hypothetical protein